MSADNDFSELEFAALISSKICHDVISPVGAIANGLEVMADDDDETMREHALELVRKSATQASAKLQFARLAFGAAGSAGAQIDLNDAQRVSQGIIEGGKHTLTWAGPAATLPKNQVKLLLNMISIALSTLPRGGTIDVVIVLDGELPNFVVRCNGPMARIPDGLNELLSQTQEGDLDAHSIQAYYTGRIANASGLSLETAIDGETVFLKASPKAEQLSEAV